MKNLKEQFDERCLRPKLWCDKHGYNYEVWRQLSAGLLTAQRGRAKAMREQLQREGFDFSYLQSSENIAKRREKYDIQRVG